jgi:hypothetical protein
MLMLISMVVSGILMVALAVLYFKTIRAIERDDINEAMARAQRLKSRRTSSPLAGA